MSTNGIQNDMFIRLIFLCQFTSTYLAIVFTTSHIIYFFDITFKALIENKLLDMSSPTTCEVVEPDTA